MNAKAPIFTSVALGLFLLLQPQQSVPATCVVDQQVGKESPKTEIVVADRALTGPHTLPQQRGSKMFLPVVSIARALGDTVTVDFAARSVKVQRQTGVVAEFNAQRNQILENGSVVMVVSDTADIVLPPNAEE